MYICVIRLIRRMNAKVIYLALLTSRINRKEQQSMRTNLFTCNVNSECNVWSEREQSQDYKLNYITK